MKYLVTERLKLKDLHPEWAKDLAKESEVDVDDLELVRKGVIADKTETDEEGVISFISMEGPDRDNEEMDPDGAILTFFNKNKVVPYGHDYRGLPVGKSMWIRKVTKNGKKGLLAKTVFLKHPFAQEVGKLYTEDVAGTGPAMKGWSIGFIPLKWREPEEKEKPPKAGEADTRPRRKYTKWELVEYSAVMIPSCREALTEMVEKGLIKSEKLKKDIAELIEIEDDPDELELTTESTVEPLVEEICPKCEGELGTDGDGQYCKECEWTALDSKKEAVLILNRAITKPEEVSDLIRLPAKGEEGKHKKHNIKWMTVSKKEGIKGIYCIDCKKIITYVFDKKAPYKWTMKRALKWMKDHGKEIQDFVSKWEEITRTKEMGDAAYAALEEQIGFMAASPLLGDKKDEEKLNEERTIWLFGVISSGTAQAICRQLLQYDKLDSEKPIKLIIGSYGGEVYSSFAIIDAMEYIKAPVETIGLGMVMSGGLLIFMAGDKRKISQNSSVLSHRFSGINWGSQAELEADRVEEDAIHNRMIEHYIKFTKLKTKEEVLEQLLQPVNVWLTAAQAIEYEIADEFVDNDWLAEVEQNQKSLDKTQKGIIPFRDTPKAPEDAPWNGPKEVRDAEISDLKVMCTWFDSENPDIKGAYKLPHHQAKGHKVVWRATAAAMAALFGARGGVQLPDKDRKGVYNHLAKEYKKFDKEPPEFREYTEQEIDEWSESLKALESKEERIMTVSDVVEEQYQALRQEIASLKEGRVLSAKNRKLIQNILTAMEAAIPPLKSLLTATEPPKEEEFELDIDKGEDDGNGGKDTKNKPNKLEIDTEQLTAIVQGVFQNNLDKIGELVADRIAKAKGKVG